jgi:hypothetical protein
MKSQAQIVIELNEAIKEICQLSDAIGMVEDVAKFGPAGDYISDKLNEAKDKAKRLLGQLN